MQGKVYKRITNIEREAISRSLATGMAIAEIAKELGRHRSSILQEIQRNSGKSGYRAFSASRRAQAAARSRWGGKNKISQVHRLREYVIEKVK